MIFRLGVVCEPCYRSLDGGKGTAENNGVRWFNLAGESLRGAAPTLTDETHQESQRQEAAKAGSVGGTKTGPAGHS
jgi:hypothetical protein